MIKFKQNGNFKNTERFLNRASNINYMNILNKYGQEGVNALSTATPIDSGETANSWSYNIDIKDNYFTISWNNSNVVDGVPVVILIQYGHATKNGGYVSGLDFITPTMKPIFNKIAEDAWKEVINL